jgi:GNAT superfamily N-acetyltransferase
MTPGDPVDDSDLARRSAASFAELLAAVARWGVGPDAVIRHPDFAGGRMGPEAESPWLDAVVVFAGAVPPPDDPHLPHCVWTFSDRVDGRAEYQEIAMPCMGLELASLAEPVDRTVEVTSPTFAEVGAANDRAYGIDPLFGPIVGRLSDHRFATHGLLVDNLLACVAMTFALGDDLGIHYVATEAAFQRRGLATRLLTAVMQRGRADGMRTATLQASPDGLPVYRRMNFREVGLLRAFVRAPHRTGA